MRGDQHVLSSLHQRQNLAVKIRKRSCGRVLQAFTDAFGIQLRFVVGGGTS